MKRITTRCRHWSLLLACFAILQTAFSQSVSISGNVNICPGGSIALTATPSGAVSPTYQWKKNGNNIPTATNATYTAGGWATGETITCSMVSGGNTYNSNTLTVFVSNVQVGLSAGVLHAGGTAPLTVNASGGTAPYQYSLDGGAYQVANTFAVSSGQHAVTVKDASNCAQTSPIITIGEVQIATSNTFVCAGAFVTFTATPVTAIPNPRYQWKVNGGNVGTNSPSTSLTIPTLANNDVVTCVMTNVPADPDVMGTPTSNAITMSVETSPTLTLSPSPTCLGDAITATLSAGHMRSFDWQNNGTSVYTKADTAAWITVAGTRSSPGNSLAHLREPGGIFVDNNGNVYVADRYNNRIQKWAPGATEGVTVAGGNGQGGALNQLSEPMSVFVDNAGAMYIAERANFRVIKWDAGATTGTVVGLGEAYGAAVDNAGNVYVADNGNHRIQKWAPGAVAGTTVAGVTGAAGSTADKLNNPVGVLLDAQNNVYVVDQGNHRIQKWAPGATVGVTIAGTGTAGAGANQLSSPTVAYLDVNQNLYVGDDGNARVQRFNYGSTEGVTVTPLDATLTAGKRASGLFLYKNQLYICEPYRDAVKAYQSPTSVAYTPLTAGSHRVSVTTRAGCTVNGNTISVLDVAVATSVGTIACNGGTTTFTATPSGGFGGAAVSNYTYNFDGAGFQNSNTVTVGAGIHTVVVKDIISNCTESATVNITEPAVLALSTPTAGTITCNGGSTTISATANGGTLPYQYGVNGGTLQSSNSFLVQAGSHSIRVVDAAGCTQSAAVAVTQPAAVTNTIVSGNIACNGGTTTITATAAGNVGTLQYSIDGINYQAANTFTKPAGTYTVTAKDANGCMGVSNSLTVSQPAVLAIAIAPAATIPSNGTTMLTATATGGTTPYEFSLNGGTFQAANTFNISTNTRDSVRVRDNNGCLQLSNTVIIANMTNAASKTLICAGASVTFTATPTNAGTTPTYQWKKNNTNVGTNSATYVAAGLVHNDVVRCEMTARAPSTVITVIGTAITISVETQPTATVAPSASCMGTPLTATLSNGTFASAVWKNGATTITGATTATYTTTAGGSHTATVTTVAGCVATSSAAAVTEVMLTINNGNPVKVLCNGGTAGISVEGSGGLAPYQYSFDGGAFSSNNLYTVNAGTYTITGKDANGCTKSVTVHVFEPAVVRVADPIAWPIACNGGTTVLSAAASGGNYVYQYSLDGFNYQSTINFVVRAGTYQVLVRDSNGCSAASNLVRIGEPAALLPTATQSAIACIGGTATVTMGAQGGTAPFTYSFNGGAFGTNTVFTGLTAGTYTLSVIDTNLCTQTVNYTVVQPTAVNGSLKVDTVICINTNTQLVVTGTGGTGALSYSLNGGAPQGNAFTVQTGTFNIVISDVNGCKKVLPPVTVKFAETWTGNTQFVPRNCLGTGLLATYPNPANEFVIIDFKIPSKSVVILKIYDMMGRLIQAMDQGSLKGGAYTSRWSTGNFDEGTVFICLEVDGVCTQNQKVRIIKR